MKKWLIPLTYPFVSVIAFLSSGAIGAAVTRNDTGYGGVIIVLIGLIFYCAIVIPAMCILYAKFCLSGEKFRFLFTLYSSLIIVLPYLIVFGIVGNETESFAYSAILFVWCEIWNLIGLIRLKCKK